MGMNYDAIAEHLISELDRIWLELKELERQTLHLQSLRDPLWVSYTTLAAQLKDLQEISGKKYSD